MTSPPTPTRTPTVTRTPLPTPTPPYRTECNCDGDLYNCDDFVSQLEAQTCLEYCKAPGYGDIHKLDPDGNGIACEGMQ
jgi:hypothetical protein